MNVAVGWNISLGSKVNWLWGGTQHFPCKCQLIVVSLSSLEKVLREGEGKCRSVPGCQMCVSSHLFLSAVFPLWPSSIIPGPSLLSLLLYGGRCCLC